MFDRFQVIIITAGPVQFEKGEALIGGFVCRPGNGNGFVTGNIFGETFIIHHGTKYSIGNGVKHICAASYPDGVNTERCRFPFAIEPVFFFALIPETDLKKILYIPL